MTYETLLVSFSLFISLCMTHSVYSELALSYLFGIATIWSGQEYLLPVSPSKLKDAATARLHFDEHEIDSYRSRINKSLWHPSTSSRRTGHNRPRTHRHLQTHERTRVCYTYFFLFKFKFSFLPIFRYLNISGGIVTQNVLRDLVNDCPNLTHLNMDWNVYVHIACYVYPTVSHPQHNNRPPIRLWKKLVKLN